MAEFIDKERFLASMGLTGDETKYGNRDAEHQHKSYSTYMSYEIIDCVDDSIVEEELAPVVHGRWERREIQIAPFGVTQVLACTNCGYDHEYDEWFGRCPNCGARMDGDSDGQP